MITYEVSDGCAIVTIDDRERHNPLSNEAMAELVEAVQRSATDDEVGVVVITGAGSKAFSAGGDLSGGFVDTPLPDHAARGALAELFRAIRVNPKPVIARVNGTALGGGFGLAVACDVTIAVEGARMGTPEIGLGLWPMMISAVLVRAMPRKALLDMMLTGRIITADEGAVLGLVTRTVPPEDLDRDVRATADALLARSPAALALGKRAFYAVEDMDFDTALDHLQLGLTATALTEDASEGVSAFIEKRSPEWKGR